MVNTIEVHVTKFRMSLLKVVYPGGYQLVAGGRLVSERKGDVHTPHPELPEYAMDMFPAPFDKWCDGLCPDVSVTVFRNGKMVPVGYVRAGTFLFTPRDPRIVRDWIREQS